MYSGYPDEKSRPMDDGTAKMPPPPSYYQSGQGAYGIQDVNVSSGPPGPQQFDAYGVSPTVYTTTPTANVSGPVASPSTGSSGSANHASAGASPETLLNPPPPCFHRTPPPISLTPFYPFGMLGFGSKLDKGFPAMPPTTRINPHPFAVCDVNQEDWSTFLNHIQMVASLSGKDKMVAGVVPLAVMGFGLTTFLVKKGIEKRRSNKKEDLVVALVDNWNTYFFNPRHLNITLAQGKRNITGPEGSIPPDMQHLQPAQLAQYEADAGQYDSSDSSEEEETNHGRAQSGIAGRREARRERRGQKRESRQMKKQTRRDRRDVKHMKVRLIVSYF